MTDDFDPEVVEIQAQQARRKKTVLALSAAGTTALLLIVGVSVTLSKNAAEAQLERQRDEAAERQAQARRVEEKKAEKTRDRIGLAAFLANAARGGNTTIDVASIFTAEAMDGYSVDDPTPSVAFLENGTVRFNERQIPAAVIKASFVSTNRAEGRRRNVCIHAAAAHDGEFKVWRQFVAKGCDQPGAQERVDEWKTENGFTAL